METQRQLRQALVRNWSRENPYEAAWIERNQDRLPSEPTPALSFADTADRLRDELLANADRAARQLAAAYELRAHHAAVADLMQVGGCETVEEAVALLRRSALAPAVMPGATGSALAGGTAS